MQNIVLNDFKERLDQFCLDLANFPDSATVSNPYTVPARLHNLRHYLLAMLNRPGRRMLVVGEALGYRGGLLTGIPFSSSRLLRSAPHPLWRQLASELLVEDDVPEATASMVWEYLARRRRLPLFWNAFPFHPHHPDNPESNRAPDSAEIAQGQRYLHTLAELYQPSRVAGLGRKGSLAASRAFPGVEIANIRHPSYGGKSMFAQGMDRLFNSRS